MTSSTPQAGKPVSKIEQDIRAAGKTLEHLIRSVESKNPVLAGRAQTLLTDVVELAVHVCDAWAACGPTSGMTEPRSLWEMLGGADIGSNPYRAPPQADINGPMDWEMLQAYLNRTGQIYPPLFQRLNAGSMEAFLEKAPESLNIEDRRPREDRRKTKKRDKD